MSRFYHLYIFPKKGVSLAEVSSVIESTTDYCQYDDHNWVIYTTFDAKEWYSRLEKFVEPGGRMFICELNISDYWGLMNNGLWKMLKRGKEDLQKKPTWLSR